MSFLFINKILRVNNFKTRAAMNVKFSLFVICVEAIIYLLLHAFFYKQRYFSTQLQCCLTFSHIELQMLLRYCLIHITIIILRHILHLVYLCICLDLGLFVSCDLFFISSLIFILINHITSFKQTYLFFVHFLEYLLSFLNDYVDEKSE